jgi:DinB superfamily
VTSKDDAIESDTKDWTWVITQSCDECGFDPSGVHPGEVPDQIRRNAAVWADALKAPGVRTRPRPSIWSPLEYGCHIRDVHRIFDHRVRLMLTEDVPDFPNWDQDETAVADDYASQDPPAVADEVLDAARVVADTYDGVAADAWSRRGLRSNGSEFTVASIAVYHLHDVVHHTFDIRGAVDSH